MLSIDAVEKVLDRRSARGASDESLVEWLEGLKRKAWKKRPDIIDGFITAIRQTPRPFQMSDVFCPRCGTAVQINDFEERHCPDCDLWYMQKKLFGYVPRHLTQLR